MLTRLYITICILVFVVLAATSIHGVNPQVDEITDANIADQLRQNPLVGPGWDGSQARLPMYAMAGLYAAVGVVNPQTVHDHPVPMGRLLSIAVGALCIVLTYFLARRLLGNTVAVLATGLLSIAPYFLGLERTAGTEGDAYCPTAVVLLLLAYFWWRDHRGSVRRTALLGVSCGIAVACKFTLGELLPVLGLVDLIDQWHGRKTLANATPRGSMLAWTLPSAVLLIAALATTRKLGLASIDPRAAHALPVALWGVGASLAIMGILWSATRRDIPSSEPGSVNPVSSANSKPGLTESGSDQIGTSTTTLVFHWLIQWGILALVTLAVTLSLPEHTLQPDIAGAFLDRASHWDGKGPLAEALRNIRLNGGLVLLKLGLPLGILTVAAFCWAILRSIKDRPLRPVVALALAYIVLIILLPYQQYFYLVSVYPLIVIVLVAFIVATHRALKGVPRAAWAVLVALSTLWLVVGVARAYPMFNAYGYETVGDQWLGSDSRGYREVIQVANDGTAELLHWCARNAPQRSVVQSFLWDGFVEKDVLDRMPPGLMKFTLLPRDPKTHPAPPDLSNADYAVVALQNVVTYRDAPSPATLEKAGFDPRPVHTAWRGHGPYRMAVGWVYRRRTPAFAPAS